MTDCSEPASFRDVLDLWKTREACVAELRDVCGSDLDEGPSSSLVSKWWQRDSVPSDWWAALLATATAKSFGLSAALFTRLAARSMPNFEAITAEVRA